MCDIMAASDGWEKQHKAAMGIVDPMGRDEFEELKTRFKNTPNIKRKSK